MKASLYIAAVILTLGLISACGEELDSVDLLSTARANGDCETVNKGELQLGGGRIGGWGWILCDPNSTDYGQWERNDAYSEFHVASSQRVKSIGSKSDAVSAVQIFINFFTSDSDGRPCSEVHPQVNWRVGSDAGAWYVRYELVGDGSDLQYRLDKTRGIIRATFIDGCPVGYKPPLIGY
jgi:hypothetical protein